MVLIYEFLGSFKVEMEMGFPLTNNCEAKYYGGITDQNMDTSTSTNYVVKHTRFASFLPAELTGKWPLLWGGTQPRMFTFKASRDTA